MKFGLIGYGKVAQLHAKGVVEAAGCELTAVTGHNEERGKACAEKWGIEFFPTVKEMAASGKVETVIVSTPHPQHCKNVLEAIEQGLNVIVEKPMGVTVAECEQMVNAAKKKGVKLGVISQRRWYPSCQRMKKAIDEGKIGLPAIGQVTVLGWRDEKYYTSDPWRGKLDAEGGGVIINQAAHQMDLLTWFMGPVEKVTAEIKNINHPYIEVEDTALATVKFKSGALGCIIASNSQKPGIYAKVYVHGTNGSSMGVQTDGGAMFIAGMSGIAEAPYNDLWTIPGEESLMSQWKKEDEDFFATIDATWYFFKLQFEDFAHSETPAVTGEDGLETVRLIEGIYKSGREERTIEYR